MHQQNFYYTTSVRLYCYLGNIIQIIKVFIFFYLRTSEIVGNFNYFFFSFTSKLDTVSHMPL